MGQKSNLLRRRSGVYVCRIVVPQRHRDLIGKGELHYTTGTRELAVAKLASAGLLAHWREKFLTLDRMVTDVGLIVLGNPVLALGGTVALEEASRLSGLSVGELLQEARSAQAALFFATPGTWGHVAPDRHASVDLEAFGEPGSPQGPLGWGWTCQSGLLRLSDSERQSAIAGLLATGQASARVFASPVFVADDLICLTPANVHMDRHVVEALRRRVAALMTPEQRKKALEPASSAVAGASSKKLSAFKDKFLSARGEKIKREQLRQITDTVDLFIQVNGDPRFCDVDNAMLERFRDEFLPSVPNDERIYRKRLKTSGVVDTVEKLRGQTYAGLTPGAIQKRMAWLSGADGFITWVKKRDSLELAGVASAGAAAVKRRRAKDNREAFSDEELKALFSDPIYANGRGQPTKAGDYYDFKPWHYWGPLIALYSGMRPNESCQLLVTDIKQRDGVWCFEVEDDAGEDSADGGRSLKTENSRRVIPVHPVLIELGLLDWREAVAAEGHRELFPYWKPHATNGRRSPMASRWFNDTFRVRRLEQTSSKRVLYSFRHNFNTKLFDQHASLRVVNALMGHSPGQTESERTYDKGPSTEALSAAIKRLDFNLPKIAKFCCPEGLKALRDAMGRKRKLKNRTRD